MKRTERAAQAAGRAPDRRQARTREAIFEAFGELLTKKSFAHITVQDIIDRANIGRSTFYAHFATRDDLLKALCEDMFSHVLSPHLTREDTHDFSRDAVSPRSRITHILYHLLENRRNIIGILTFERGELFYGFFRQFLNESRTLGPVRAAGDGAPPMDFLVNHVSSSFAGMVQWWIDSGLKETPEQLADWFMAVIDLS